MVRIVEMDLSNEGMRDCASFLGDTFNRLDHFTPAYIDWQYRKNPLGKAIAFNALDDSGRIVGHYALQQLDVMLMGERARGLLAINGAVSMDAQGGGIFTKTVKTAEEHVRSLGFIFKIGVSNRIATLVHTKKTGLKLVCPLKAMLGIGIPVYRTKDDDPDYQNIWSAESLNWRIRNPSSRYRLIHRKDELEVQVHTGRAGIAAIIGRLNSDLFKKPYPVGFSVYNPVKLWIGIDNRIDWNRSLYFNMPLMMRPSPLNLMFKDISGSGIVLDPDRIRFQAIDFDAY